VFKIRKSCKLIKLFKDVSFTWTVKWIFGHSISVVDSHMPHCTGSTAYDHAYDYVLFSVLFGLGSLAVAQ